MQFSLFLALLAFAQVARTTPLVAAKTEDEVAAIGAKPCGVFRRAGVTLRGCSQD
ncbi:hypothetical protein BV25DRAFT_1819772 [Artomyces pyxidatus]|uniref:Uncharacterized protein n=1 Tax=Artomyces pyxidatus TaxID=48021 RepID=A0ACB8TG68_9AGAM|nr:hypothetical protein BV25DRAFT_1819772 [Artomyces pyxidatus]